MGKPTRSAWSRPERGIAAMVVAIFLPCLFSGCALLDRQQRGDRSEAQGLLGKVKARGSQIEALRPQASGGALLPLGEATALHSEMAYHAERGESDEVLRIDGMFDGTLKRVTDAASQEQRAARAENDDITSQLKAARDQAAAARNSAEELRGQHELEIQALNLRLEAAVAARDRAIGEVVRLRSRIQGMAEQAQAVAMFAEARVIMDRMEEDSFNSQSRQMVVDAKGYLDSGKKLLDEGQSGGAAYMFEMVSVLYQEFREKIDPRRLTVVAGSLTLRASPSASGARVGTLSRGDVVQALQKKDDWVLVKPTSGPDGWLKRDTVR